MAPEDRIIRAPIKGRPKLAWPGGARVALWVCPNIEHYEFLPPPVRVRDPWPRTPHPDILLYSQKDHANRVGVWRFFELFDRFDLRGTVSLSLNNWERFPEVMEGCLSRRWDVMCHGIHNTDYLWGYAEEEERAYIADCVATYRRLTGRMLRGWFSPALSHTLNTPDLVAEAGISYFCDLFHDDQPTPLRVRSGRLISLPYTVELNDSHVMTGAMEGEDYAQAARDMFDTLYAEGAESGRVMCLALHPFVMGRPHRIRHLAAALDYILGHSGVWAATGEEIADWYLAHGYDAAMRAAGEG
jgi:peptidoglycan/xylan/chitin deacetylase (PgdA/CDA1 family)